MLTDGVNARVLTKPEPTSIGRCTPCLFDGLCAQLADEAEFGLSIGTRVCHATHLPKPFFDCLLTVAAGHLLDETGLEILQLLTSNARRPCSDIADAAGLSAPAGRIGSRDCKR